MGFLHEIQRQRLKIIKESQEAMFSPRLFGRKTTTENYFAYLYRNTLIENEKRNFFVNFRDEKARQFSCDTFEKVQKQYKKFTFYTPNVYYHPITRTKDHLTLLNAIVLDFDLTKDGTKRSYTPDELAYVIYNELDMYPHFVYRTATEGNYQAVLLIKPMMGTKDCIYLYESIVKRMAIIFGSDFSATDATHLFRIPKGEVYIYADPLEVYDINDFRVVFDDENINKELDRLRKRLTNPDGKVISLTETQLLKQPAIEMLMNCEIISNRNNACFTLSLFFYSLGKDIKWVRDFFDKGWLDKANSLGIKKLFPKSEMIKTVKSAFSGRYAGASADWIEFVTGEEFHYQIYRSTYLKKSEEERVYMSKTTLRRRFIEWVKDNPGEMTSQKKLAEILDVSLRSLKLQIKELTDENMLEITTKSGRNGGSSFILIENKFTMELHTPDFDEIKTISG